MASISPSRVIFHAVEGPRLLASRPRSDLNGVSSSCASARRVSPCQGKTHKRGSVGGHRRSGGLGHSTLVDDKADIEGVARSNDKYDGDPSLQGAECSERTAADERPTTEQHHGNVERERRPFQCEKISAVPIGDVLVEQD
jgi:hypothetical protein